LVPHEAISAGAPASFPLAADVTSKEQVDRMVAEAAEQLGGLHILVNSGSAPGGSPTATGPIETVIDEDIRHFERIGFNRSLLQIFGVSAGQVDDAFAMQCASSFERSEYGAKSGWA
jgi:NAD(P)-dependent dehydrogenase (short-subunit alcohol dehydrogenase family)